MLGNDSHLRSPQPWHERLILIRNWVARSIVYFMMTDYVFVSFVDLLILHDVKSPMKLATPIISHTHLALRRTPKDGKETSKGPKRAKAQHECLSFISGTPMTEHPSSSILMLTNWILGYRRTLCVHNSKPWIQAWPLASLPNTLLPCTVIFLQVKRKLGWSVPKQTSLDTCSNLHPTFLPQDTIRRAMPLSHQCTQDRDERGNQNGILMLRNEIYPHICYIRYDNALSMKYGYGQANLTSTRCF